MTGEQNLAKLLKEMAPYLNPGEYVFITSADPDLISRSETLCEFKEKEGITYVISKFKADELGLSYHFIASWITLNVHSSLSAIGLTAKVSTTLADNDITCNMVAAFYHDHIFVDVQDKERAMKILFALSEHQAGFE